MGKKNSKNSKRSDKTFKAFKTGTDKEMKAFLKWLEDQISDISHLPANMSAAIQVVLTVWTTQSRLEIFLECSRDRNLFAPVYCSKIRELFDAGQFELARPWVITFCVALHLEKKQAERRCTKIDMLEIVTYIVMYDCAVEKKAPLSQMKSYAPLVHAYTYARPSRVSLSHFLIEAKEAYLVRREKSNYAFCRGVRDIQIIFNVLELIQDPFKMRALKTRVCINASIQLKTLVMMFTGGPINDFYVHVLAMGRKVSPKEFHLRISDLTFELGQMNEICIIPKSCQFQMSPNANNIRSEPTSPRNEVKQSTIEGCVKKSSIDVSSKLKTRPSNIKKKNSRGSVDYCTNTNNDRLEHSNRLGLVFEEAAEIFKERRRRLNDLAIKKSAPKQKSPSKVQTHVDESEVLYHNTSFESKAGKTFFPVLIGHEEYLYKSSKASKLSQVSPRSLDLHGCTRDEALFKLSSSLPEWLDAAMKEHPYTLPVNIITGGGSQIVADAVEHWIRESRNVANRF